MNSLSVRMHKTLPSTITVNSLKFVKVATPAHHLQDNPLHSCVEEVD